MSHKNMICDRNSALCFLHKPYIATSTLHRLATYTLKQMVYMVAKILWGLSCQSINVIHKLHVKLYAFYTIPLFPIFKFEKILSRDDNKDEVYLSQHPPLKLH